MNYKMLIASCVLLLLSCAIFLGYMNIHTVTAIFVLLLFTGVVSLIVYITSKIDKATDKENKKDNMYYFNKVNELLKNMPEGDMIEWGGGIDIRIDRKSFKNAEDKMTPYIAISGDLKYWKKRVVVIYDIVNDDISKYYGDPSPELINNPFKNFDPYGKERKQMGMGRRIWDPRRRRYITSYDNNYEQPAGVNVNVGGNMQDDGDSADEVGERGAELLRKFQDE